MYVGMSEIARERNDLHAATQLLLRSQELGEHTGLPQNPYRWRVAMARVREAEGDLPGALDLINEAEHLYVSDFFPNARPVPALRARVWIALGRLGEALGWAREQSLSVDDNLSYLHEFEHITLARLLLARYRGSARSLPFRRRPGSWSAFCWRRKQGAGRAASSRSWCCGRSRTRRSETSRLRLAS
jgi:LuxR family maltose regulon positive regulatory protein